MDYFKEAVRIQVAAGRLTPEFYQKLRDAAEKMVDPPDDEEEEPKQWYSCHCGEVCRC